MNKETLQSYNNELGQNNADLDAILETINNLPEAGSGGSTPEKGFVFTDFDENGHPKTLNLYGYTRLYGSAFYKYEETGYSGYDNMYDYIENLNINDELIEIYANAFKGWEGLKKVNLKNAGWIAQYAFGNMPNLASVIASNLYFGVINMFGGDTNLKALWLGARFQDITGATTSMFGDCSLKKIYIDLPRATVEGIGGYNAKWGASSATIICNDDEGFMTQDEFDAIDWSTYTG